MNKNLRIKLILVLAVGAIALWSAYPPFNIVDPDGNMTKKGKVNLGLDLQGGMHLVLKVDTSKLDENEKKDATDRALEIIRNRIDEFGVLEPTVQREGEERIIIQLPGVIDRERALKLIGRTAFLEFRLVSDDPELLSQALSGEEVAGYELKHTDTGSRQKEPLLVQKAADLTGEVLVDATVEFEQQGFNEPYVAIAFNSRGGAIFSQLTADNVGRRLAIVLDGNVQTAPVIRERIPNGRASISGSYSMNQANDLAIILRAGALPAPVHVIEERTVGPTLGKDSIEKGLTAIMIGGLLVVIFMIIYYLAAGIIAVIALLFNLTLIIGILGYFGATLTLPGIAGLVLTIGMAVDANVLIFERIREELKQDKGLKGSIASGYKKAFLTILDSNLTTLITALILFQFGTGPVRGFATTLSIGILASMFAALIVTKLILDIMCQNNSLKKITMMQIIKEPCVDFLKFRKITYIISIVVISIGLISFILKGDKNFGIDFTGGTIQQFKFAESVKLGDIRKSLTDIGLGHSQIQQFGSEQEIIVRTFEETTDKVKNKFEEAYGTENVELMRMEKVGPSIAQDLVHKALWALALAMIGICIYVSVRFEFRYALAAILALLHDVLLAVGAMALTGRELSLPVIAALLTVVGYSINDTIVIFDRIREDRRIMYKAKYYDIVNMGLNHTLSRTMITSLTTLLVVTTLFISGGEVINDFAFILLIGVIAGTYSSLFVASPALLDWAKKKK